MTAETNGARPTRSRGRPRLEIDRDAVADAVAELFSEGGIEAVSIADTAEKLSVSRATLYRTVPTKDDLLGILFERSTRELTQRVETALSGVSDPGEQLVELIRLQSEAAIQMRSYMPVFFGGGGLPTDVFTRWRKWSRQFEKQWSTVVEACMDAGYLDKGDPLVATRLILGMIIWVSRWYRPAEKITAEEIADSAVALLRLKLDAPSRAPSKTSRRSRAK